MVCLVSHVPATVRIKRLLRRPTRDGSIKMVAVFVGVGESSEMSVCVLRRVCICPPASDMVAYCKGGSASIGGVVSI